VVVQEPQDRVTMEPVVVALAATVAEVEVVVLRVLQPTAA
jgi:hypothetical protein